MDSLIVLSGVAMLSFLAGYFYQAISSTPDGFWCRGGKHYLAAWKPCPCCIGEMVSEYKQKQQLTNEGGGE